MAVPKRPRANNQKPTLRGDGCVSGALANMTSIPMGKGSIHNPKTGYGTTRSSQSHNRLSPIIHLSEWELEKMYRDSPYCGKIIDLLPEDAIALWSGVSLQSDTDLESAEIMEWIEDLGVKQKVWEACALARLYGNGFLLLGVDDGQRLDMPLDLDNPGELVYLEALDATIIHPTNGLIDSEYFTIAGSSHLAAMTVHKSRLLKFTGRKLIGNMARRSNVQGWRDDSVLQPIVEALFQYLTGTYAGVDLLTKHSIYVHKLAGLNRLEDDPESREMIMNRMITLGLGLSTNGGMLIDKEKEEIELVQRNFSGVATVMGSLESHLVNASGYPPSKLLGFSKGGAFSESGLSDRYEWATILGKYSQNQLKPNLRILLKVLLASRGYSVKMVQPLFDSGLVLTDAEISEIRETNSKTDKTYFDMGILSAHSIGVSRFSGKYSNEITVPSEEIESLSRDAEKTPVSTGFGTEGDKAEATAPKGTAAKDSEKHDGDEEVEN